jgi:hypothetical protein
MILTNKHLVVAMIVAPILAIIAWMAVDKLIGETPHAAVKGNSYELIPRPNCRYTSGECELVNSDFVSSLKVERVDGQRLLKLTSNVPLDGVKIGFSNEDLSQNQTPDIIPNEMESTDSENLAWSIGLPNSAKDTTQIFVAMSAGGVRYFSQTGMAFMERKLLVDVNQ